MQVRFDVLNYQNDTNKAKQGQTFISSTPLSNIGGHKGHHQMLHMKVKFLKYCYMLCFKHIQKQKQALLFLQTCIMH